MRIVSAPETADLSKAPNSFAQVLLDRFSDTPDHEAFRFRNGAGEWQSLSWAEVHEEATTLAAGLMSLGVQLEDRVAIAAETSMNWIFASLAATLAGGAVTTVYASTGPEDVAFILSDSNSKVLFAQDETQLQKVLDKRDAVPDLVKVVLFTEVGGDGEFSISLSQLRELGRETLAQTPDTVTDRAGSVRRENLATLIYTSGTTGRPKGVELLHSSWVNLGPGLDAIGLWNSDDVQLLWLPMAHVFGTVLLAIQIATGSVTAVDGRVPKILENMAEIKPTFMGAVPRIFEKVHGAIWAMAKAQGEEAEAGFNWGIEVAKEYRRVIAAGEEPSEQLAADFATADELVLARIREVMGGHIRFFVSGAAPLSAEVAEFFNAAGMPILEGYGLTETSSVGTMCRPDSLAFGTVGQPSPSVEVAIADDGEILIRGPILMRGYRNNPEATNEVMLEDGWFATGDIGEFDDRDRLRITDRKKDLYKTSGGKYVAPSPIESQFKGICALASNMVVHANNRKFVSALITLDPDAAAAWAAARGKDADLAQLSRDPELTAAIQADVDQLNERLNHWEQVQKFVVLERDFGVDTGELTPSLKVKRKVVEERNRDLLDALYA